jgi:hypothetical protein
MPYPTIPVTLHDMSGELEFTHLVVLPRINEIVHHDSKVYRVASVIHTTPTKNSISGVTIILDEFK